MRRSPIKKAGSKLASVSSEPNAMIVPKKNRMTVTTMPFFSPLFMIASRDSAPATKKQTANMSEISIPYIMGWGSIVAMAKRTLPITMDPTADSSKSLVCLASLVYSHGCRLSAFIKHAIWWLKVVQPKSSDLLEIHSITGSVYPSYRFSLYRALQASYSTVSLHPTRILA